MTLEQHIQQLRQLVLEHPDAAQKPIVMWPHGHDSEQEIEHHHLTLTGHKVVLEARR